MGKTSYMLGKKIARGGMAEIYLGKAMGEDSFQKIVAIKRILPHYSQDKEFVDMFRDEANICKLLQHANIVQVHDFTKVEGSYSLIMEHVHGADFRTLLAVCENAKRRLSVPMTLYIAACTARGLHYAHTKTDEQTGKPLGIVHRDVSPQNILISFEGEVKITDFGIASADEKMNETRPGVVKGKYSYMSPEQVQAKHLDGRSDVFSLAIVLWESLAMKRLFSGDSEVETIRKVQKCEIPHRLTELNPEVDEKLMYIVHKGLARDPVKRFQNAAAFEKALLTYLHSRHPDFLASELGDFLKLALADKRKEIEKVIKTTLTSSHEPKPNAEKKTDHTRSRRSRSQSSRKITMSSADVTKAKEITLADGKSNGPRHPISHSSQAMKSTQSELKRLRTGIHQLPVRTSSNRNSRVLFPIIMALIMLGLIYVNRDRFSSTTADLNFHLRLKTEPPIVQINVDRKRKTGKHGRFIKTPTSIRMSPGQIHKVSIKRPGYESVHLDVRGGAGKTKEETLYLKKKKTTWLFSLKVTSPGRNLFVNIDEGLRVGTTPLVVGNLSPNITHTIDFKDTSRPKAKALRCSFKPHFKGSGRAMVVSIYPQRKGANRCIAKSK